MAGLDEESGLLKPTVQKTRGLTALVVAAAALSFFAGAPAATHATTTTELWGKWKAPKAPVRPGVAAARPRRRPRSLVVVVVHARRLRQVRAGRLRVLLRRLQHVQRGRGAGLHDDVLRQAPGAQVPRVQLEAKHISI